MITAQRHHDISCGHRVVGHESKCRHMHGHNYRVHFCCTAKDLDNVGRVIDFSVIKEKLCMWIEQNWDHKFLAWEKDKEMRNIQIVLNDHACYEESDFFGHSIVWTPFNPTAENMAEHLLNVVGPQQLEGTGVVLVAVTVEETAKCHASAYK
jgi:6-pyruvoyltetrahydropterin/6-carboxytetrahydropterin synthase